MAVKGAKGKSGRIVVWVILVLLVVGLAGFGATNFGGGVRQIGSVGDVEITIDEYGRALQQEIQQLSQQTGQRITRAARFGIDQIVLQRLVGRAALDNEAQRIGLSVGDEQVARDIRAVAAFQGVDGEFDRESYEFVLDRNGLTPGQFEEQIRADTARGLLQAAVTGGVRIPQVYVDTLYGYAREGRDVTWAVTTAENLQDEIADPTDAELEAFHEANPDLFTAPEGRVITYAWITPEMLAGQIDTDEEMLRQLYEERSDQYRQPERRLVERLVFGSEDEAQAAADAIATGETTFDTLVEERGLTLADVDLGDLSRDELGAAADVVFALEEPGVAGPAPTDLGPGLFRVNAILAEDVTTFEEARDDLAAEVENDQARRVIEDMRPEIDDLLAGGATLEDLAAETELELGTITLEPGTTEGPAAYEAFRTEAQAVIEGDYPEVRELEDGGMFALRLDEVRPPELRPLADVRDQVAEAWRAAQVQAALMEEAEADAVDVKAGATFEAQDLTPGTVEGVTRDGVVEGLPPEAIEAIFEMQPGDARAVATPEGAAVIRLDRIVPADQDSEEAQSVKSAFAEQSAATLADDILSAFVRAAEQDAGISLDQSAINAVQTQLP